MARTLLDLAQSMERRAAALGTVGNQRAIDVARAILRDLGIVSPVDSSLFVSNWQVKLDGHAVASIPAFFFGSNGSSRAESVEAMLRMGDYVLDGKRPGQTIYISNVLPYAQRLNEGHSKQEPAFFVERAALLGRKLAGGVDG